MQQSVLNTKATENLSPQVPVAFLFSASSLHSLNFMEADVNKTIRIFHTSFGPIVVTVLKPQKHPALPVAATPVPVQCQQTPRPVILGNLNDFVKSGVVR